MIIIICYLAVAFIQSNLQLIRLSRGQSPPPVQCGVKGWTFRVAVMLSCDLGCAGERTCSGSSLPQREFRATPSGDVAAVGDTFPCPSYLGRSGG